MLRDQEQIKGTISQMETAVNDTNIDPLLLPRSTILKPSAYPPSAYPPSASLSSASLSSFKPRNYSPVSRASSKSSLSQ